MVRAAPVALHDQNPLRAAARPLLLASRSPRRRRLLEEAGIPHTSQDPGIDDGLLRPGGATPSHWVAALAYLKAACALARHGRIGACILGADTVCIVSGRIMGQPRDEADAAAMLHAFEDRPHQVLTGVAILSGPDQGSLARREIFADSATVHMGVVGPARMAEYLSTGAWRGKAGAYNLEDRLAAGWPIRFDGDPTTVVGLPMRLLLPRLRRLGVLGGGGVRAA